MSSNAQSKHNHLLPTDVEVVFPVAMGFHAKDGWIVNINVNEFKIFPAGNDFSTVFSLDFLLLIWCKI